MTDSLLFTDEFKRRMGEKYGNVGHRIATGPTAEELVAQRRGELGLGGGEPGIGIAPTRTDRAVALGKRGLQAALSPATLVMGSFQRAAEASKARLRESQLKNLVSGMAVASELAKSIAASPEAVREQIYEQAAQGLTSGTAPQTAGLLDFLLKHETIAHMDRQEQVSVMMKDSPTLMNLIRSGQDPTEAIAKKPELAETIGMEIDKAEAFRDIPDAQKLWSRILREHKRQFPERHAQLEESEKAISAAEAREMYANLKPNDPQLSERAVETGFFNVVRHNPDALRIKPDPAVAAEREKRMEKSIEAEYREGSKPTVDNYRTPDGKEMLGQITPQGLRLQDPQTGAFTVHPPANTLKVPMQISGTRKDVFPGAGEATGRAMEIAGHITQTMGALDALEEYGAGVTGVRGWLNSEVIGYVAQVNKAAGNAAADFIAQTPDALEKTTEFRQRVRGIVGAAIRTLRIEEKGRVTDMDRQLSEQALALVETSKSYEQSLRGLQTLLELQIVRQDADIIWAGGKPAGLETEEDVLAMRDRLRKMGLTDQLALKTMKSMKTNREQVAVLKDALERAKSGAGGQ